MRKKSFAATITIIFCAIFVSVIGATFSTYLFRKNIIKIEDPIIQSRNGIVVYNNENNEIQKLNLSDMALGLKPATGEENVDNEIPSTVTSKVGSEGYYAKFKVTSDNAYKILIANIKIKSTKRGISLEGERENIKVALEGVNNSTKNLVGDNIVLFNSSEGTINKEFTLLVWLTAKASDQLKGATISFDVVFE